MSEKKLKGSFARCEQKKVVKYIKRNLCKTKYYLPYKNLFTLIKRYFHEECMRKLRIEKTRNELLMHDFELLVDLRFSY